MPRTHSIEILCSSRSVPDLDGFTYSAYCSAYIPDDEICDTEVDGIIHENDVTHCGRCQLAVCHDDNAGENTTHIEDVDEWWCDSCRDEHAHESADGEWYSERQGGLLSYHSGERKMYPVTDEKPYRIGFEVEKEDREFRETIENEDITFPEGWVCERDGSLNDQTGFEVISPAYNAEDGELIRKDIASIEDLLDADVSTSCGGHISISDKRFTPLQLSERIRPLFPLLLALYPKRLRGTYCKAMTDKDKDEQPDRYQAFAFQSHRIELRVPSAVRSAKSLLWRYELVAHFLVSAKDKPLTWTWMRKELRNGGKVRSMLEEVYTVPDDEKATKKKVREVLRLYSAFAGWYYRGITHNELADFIRNYVPKEVPAPRTEVSTPVWSNNPPAAGYTPSPATPSRPIQAGDTVETTVHLTDYWPEGRRVTVNRVGEGADLWVDGGFGSDVLLYTHQVRLVEPAFAVGQRLMYTGGGPCHGHICYADSRGQVRPGAIGVTWLTQNVGDLSGEDTSDLRPATPEELTAAGLNPIGIGSRVVVLSSAVNVQVSSVQTVSSVDDTGVYITGSEDYPIGAYHSSHRFRLATDREIQAGRRLPQVGDWVVITGNDCIGGAVCFGQTHRLTQVRCDDAIAISQHCYYYPESSMRFATPEEIEAATPAPQEVHF